MSQDELDALFSYSYNVGSTTFAKRTIPHLVKLYNGTGTLNNVLNNIYGTKDKTLPGLRKRRDIERQLFKDAYNRRTS
jgi:GH24 family phage-related lysozyme (muramidase)